jgi:lysyl-tRNA synthetase class 2
MSNNNEEKDNLSEVVRMRVEKYQKLTDEGNYPYRAVSYDVDLYASDINQNFELHEGKTVHLAGRIMAKRGQGKIAFFDLADSTDRIQLYIKAEFFDEATYSLILSYDIGDIVGVYGEVIKTQRGQISIKVTQLPLLSKSIQPLPEKFHGLKDPDLRYRQRYVDLIVNPQVKASFIARSKIISAIRTFMDGRGFLEVETPVLSTLAGGATARPFISHHNALDIQMYLRIALELPLKRLIVGGFDKVYEIGRVFRNEGMDQNHNPEFTMMESYEAYADYNKVMTMIEALFAHVASALSLTDEITYKEQVISFKPPFTRQRMVDLVAEHTGVNFDLITDLEEAKDLARELKLEVKPDYGIGKIIEEAFDTYVEDKLLQPTFVTHHPTEISPLSKKSPEDPRYTERFELFICGKEFANGFSELNDPFDQRSRFEDQQKKKSLGDDEAHPYDQDFINALEIGLPPTGGVGVGIDRLVMLFTGELSIRDVIFFPTMKPLE